MIKDKKLMLDVHAVVESSLSIREAITLYWIDHLENAPSGDVFRAVGFPNRISYNTDVLSLLGRNLISREKSVGRGSPYELSITTVGEDVLTALTGVDR